jgi:hypothetical protein
MYFNNSINILKSLYNIYLTNVATWQSNAASAQLAGNQLQQTIALAKVEAYQDCANSIYNIIQQGI